MTRYTAFLRAVNVGGRVVKMDRLKRLFEALGLGAVETVLASGNVLFESAALGRTLERRIEACLAEALGYEVATFLRTDREVRAIAAHAAFAPAQVERAAASNVAFLAEPLDAGARRQLAALETAIDAFRAHGREVYWLCRKKQSESEFSNAVLEKTLGVRSTLRGLATVRRIALKYAADDA